ncbi:MAG: DUF6129 family protein [Candidatus Thiodiazotropha sp.]
MIAQAEIDRVAELLSEAALDDGSIDRLRSHFPNIHFTCCMDDDVCGVAPRLGGEGFNLYLIDSRDHCLTLTQDREIASGILVAELEGEE